MEPLLIESAVIDLQGPMQEATWQVPGSKSITNRAFVLAALSPGTTELKGVLQSDDTKHMRNALIEMGVDIEEQSSTEFTVTGGVSNLKEPSKDLFIGNSGTTVRFLTSLASLVPGKVTFVGDEHMAKRPLRDVVEALRDMDVEIDCPTGCPPLTITGGKLKGGYVKMKGDKSSQYFSSLMLSGCYCEIPMTIQVVGTLVSLPYVKMTMKMIEDFGGKVEHDEENNLFKVSKVTYDSPGSYIIEPDASSASYAFAAAAALGCKVTVPYLNEKSIQGDYGFVDILAQMGCTVEASEDGGTTVIGPSRGTKLKAVDVDMFHISDTVMTLAALAPLCDGPVKIRNIANIRIKETDRLAATVNELERLGQKVKHGDSWLEITPKPVTPAVIECYSDHRMAMSFAILGLACEGITIKDPACTAKTYPKFWDDLEAFRKTIESSSGETAKKKPKNSSS